MASAAQPKFQQQNFIASETRHFDVAFVLAERESSPLLGATRCSVASRAVAIPRMFRR